MNDEQLEDLAMAVGERLQREDAKLALAESCTVRERVAGARERAGCRYACAVSGIAGPTGGSEGKPVGLVWIAWADGDRVVTERFQFGGDREQVRRRTVAAALEGLTRL